MPAPFGQPQPDWRSALLQMLQAPPSSDNLEFLRRWQTAEGGNGPQRNNWLNTTMPGGQSINSVGVQQYPSQDVGIQKTAQTLLQHGGHDYAGIVAALRAGNGSTAANTAQEEFAKWSGTQGAATAAYIKNFGGDVNPNAPQAGVPVFDAQAMGMSPGELNKFFKQLDDTRAQEAQDAHQQVQQMNSARDQAFGQLQQAQQQPMPQNDPKAEFFTNLLGNLSQALSPQMNGQQAASSTLEDNIGSLTKQRTEKMQLLIQNWDHLASQAEKFGDLEKATNLHAKSHALMEKMQIMAQNAHTNAMGRLASAKTQKDTDAAAALVTKNHYDKQMASIQAMRVTARTTRNAALKNKNQNDSKVQALHLDANRKEANADFQEKQLNETGKISEPDILPHIAETVRNEMLQHPNGQRENIKHAILAMSGDEWRSEYGKLGISREELINAVENIWPKESGAQVPSDHRMTAKERRDAHNAILKSIGPAIGAIPTALGGLRTGLGY